ncbi:hypothetical protein JX266_008819 [Neoarthrinium moseri]|nr:hypothetical protein JX266_008819 [Neoarthrinium moseri]
MKTSVAISTAVLGFASTLVAAQYNTTATTTATPTQEPCALVSASWVAQTATTPTPTVEAALAYQCLNSVPINKESALKFLDALVPYLEWQSDTAFKKNPPADYFYPPYDLWAELARIREGVAADAYPNEYSWQADLYNSAWAPGHDGHLIVYTDVLTIAVEWARQWALVSISEDGSSLPVIKVYGDVLASPETASVVKLINGVDAATFLGDWIFKMSSNQEPDSAYNSLFFSKAYNQSGNQGYFKSGGRPRYVYPDAETTLTFENGTEVTLPNIARLKGDWRGVTDGAAFLSRFARNAVPSTTASASSLPSQTATSTIESLTTTASPSIAAASTSVPGYPAPYIISSDRIVSGYFLEGEGFEDVAVLAMTSFSPSNPPEFQQVVQDFFEAAVAAGKKKIVLDVQTNGGGYIFQGYDTFRQLFPDIVQNGTGRWRNSAGFDAVANVTSAVCADFDPLTADAALIFQCNAVWNWQYDIDVSDNNFKSYEDKFGPIEFNGDQYTDVMQWNFSNPLDTSNTTFGIGYDVTGYGSRDNFKRPFGGPENIVLLLDGYCASTCTLFSQFLKWDAGVKSIAMGGRPKEGPIQGVGGVKGSQSYSFSGVYDLVNTTKGYTNDTELLAELDRYSDYVFDRALTLNLNVKDEILPPNLEDGTPAQYIAEYADCRLYWTEDMHTDITNLWKAAATAAFNGGKCASGGFDSAPATRRSADRPAPFNKGRITLPVKTPERVPVASIAKRTISDKVHKLMMEQQHMMVID